MGIGKKMGVIVVVGIVVGIGGAYGEETAADLPARLERGEVWAQGWGAGDAAVEGMIGRSAYGPRSVSIAPGTQFWSQRQGVQGMTTIGSLHIDLSRQWAAKVHIPAACTNIGLRTPTAVDRMVIASCPDRRMARLTQVIASRRPPQPAAQLAVWAVANNPAPAQIDRYLHEVVNSGQPEAVNKRQGLMITAASLLREAGLAPDEFRMFE